MPQKVFLHIAFSCTTVLVLWYTTSMQPSVPYDACALCDGKQYLAAYDYFKGNTSTYCVKFPFHSRVAVPWLAAQLPTNNAQQAFTWLHWGFTLLAIHFLLFCWQAMSLPRHLQVIGGSWLLFHWTGIVRFNVYDFATVDVPLYLLHSLLLLVFIRPRWLWLLLPITPLAVAQKESWFALIIIWALYELIQQRFFSAKPTYKRFRWLGIAVLLGFITKVLLNHWFVPVGGEGKNSLITLLFFVRETLQNPLDLLRWVVAMFVGFGGWWLLAWQNVGKLPKKLNILPMLIVFSALHLLLGILAGRDMTRIMFLGYPFIMTLVLWRIQAESKWVLVATATLSLPIIRFFSLIPLQTSQNEAFKTWFPEYADLGTVAAWAAYMVLSYWLIAQSRRWWSFLFRQWQKNEPKSRKD
ncbi:hypothetical protein [uncultured Microscilla sp.]|uniref:hypothetical protein n=1 Tax=uncultured Microscilla sp. TaxID=432653 RepID=UPI002626341D|nr:hypothetical protein [uncultured Microscilla sp.]